MEPSICTMMSLPAASQPTAVRLARDVAYFLPEVCTVVLASAQPRSTLFLPSRTSQTTPDTRFWKPVTSSGVR